MTARLDALRSRPRRPGLASFFWYEARFGAEAVKVMPGEYFVDSEELLVMTTLGSCVATCLWDRRARVGGMNHFMLPEAAGGGDGADQGGRYGSFAMELLVNELLKRGATRPTLEAKVFGGGRIAAGMDSMDIGEANCRFVLDYLHAERIPVVSSDMRGSPPRNACFLYASGMPMVDATARSRSDGLANAE